MPTKFVGLPEEVLALNTFIKLTRAAESFGHRIFAHGALEDLTPSQFGVLEILHHLGPMCPGELSQKLLKSTGNMTMVIDNLEKRGLVIRERSVEDRRMILIRLTEAGSQLINRIFPMYMKALLDEISILTPQEQTELGRLCKKLGKKE